MQKTVLRCSKQLPLISPQAFVSPKAIVSGDIQIEALCSIWPNAVLRGDINKIVVHQASNLQENVIVHVSQNYDVRVGSYVTVGHGAILHGCHVGDYCLIGMHATLLDGAQIGDHCIVGAQTLITQHKIIPPYSLVIGNPGRIVRNLTDKDLQLIQESAQAYLDLMIAEQ